MDKQGDIPDAEIEEFIRSLRKRSFTHRDVTRCYSMFVKNEYQQNDDIVQQPQEIYGRQRAGGKRIPIRWSEQETEALKEGVARFGKGNWSRIIGLYPDIFGPTARTGRDLKKKWNSIENKNNNQKAHSSTRYKATLVLPNNEIAGIPPSVPILTPILPRSDINPNESIIDNKEIKNDLNMAKISNAQHLLNMANAITDKIPNGLKVGSINPNTNFSPLIIADLPKDTDVTDLLGIPKESEVFRVSDDNHQLLMTMNLAVNNALKQNEKESNEEK